MTSVLVTVRVAEIFLALLLVLRFGAGNRHHRTMAQPTAAYLPHQSHTFQVIMNSTDVCTLNKDFHSEITLLDYLNRNFARINDYGHNHVRNMINRMIRDRIREYRNERRRSRNSRTRHRTRLRKQRQRQRVQLDLDQREGSTRERRSTENRQEGCLPVGAFGLDRDTFRNNDNSSTRLECCYPRGYSTEHDGYLSLCAACSATTTLSGEFFPRDIHEHVCLGDLLSPQEAERRGSHGCLRASGTWHGKCSQKTVYQTVFRRQQKSCDIQPINSERHLKVEEWKREVVPVRSGCECRMDQRSALAKLVDEGL